jgi:hypothetical protein
MLTLVGDGEAQSESSQPGTLNHEWGNKGLKYESEKSE